MAKGPEYKVKQSIKHMLASFGAWEFMPVANGYGRPGIPDLIACCNGVFIGIEAKAARGKLRPAQKIQLEAIREAGGVSLVVNEHNLFMLSAVLTVLTGTSPTGNVVRGALNRCMAYTLEPLQKDVYTSEASAAHESEVLNDPNVRAAVLNSLPCTQDVKAAWATLTSRGARSE